MSQTLEQVLADERGDAAVLRARGHAHDAELIESVCNKVAAAARDYLTMLPEADARLWSGKSTEWLRARFPEWAALGHAELRGRVRYYRAIVLPRRARVVAAREAGRAGARRKAS